MVRFESCAKCDDLWNPPRGWRDMGDWTSSAQMSLPQNFVSSMCPQPGCAHYDVCCDTRTVDGALSSCSRRIRTPVCF